VLLEVFYQLKLDTAVASGYKKNGDKRSNGSVRECHTRSPPEEN
jgi:hypothetical protein